MISVAKFVRGFSKAVVSGISPKNPKEEDRKMRATPKTAAKKHIQNQRIGFEKLRDAVFFFAIITI
jgi:hypothetical protein